MIPGVVAQGARGGAISTGPIATDSAVQFNAAYLVGNLSCTDNEFFGFSGFFKSDWSTIEVAFIVQDFMTSLSGFGAPPPHNVEFSANSFNDVQHVSVIESGTADTTWHHIIGAAKTNLAAGTKIIKLFIDGVDVSGVTVDADASFNFSSNAAQLWVGWNGDPFSVGIPKYNGSMCNLWVGPGINLLTGSTISSTTIQLFRKPNGCPEDPAVAIAALGAPPVFLCGNAAQFPSNTYGTGGSFTIISGTLTDDANGPCTGLGAAVGLAAGTGTATAVGFSILPSGAAIGTAHGTGSAGGNSGQFALAAGTGTAAAVSLAIIARAASASGTGVATAVSVPAERDYGGMPGMINATSTSRTACVAGVFVDGF